MERTLLRVVGRGVFAVLAGLTSVVAARYFALPLPETTDAAFATHLAGHGVALYAHAGGGILALLMSVVQFLAPRSGAGTRAHRVLGRMYVGAVAVAAASGLFMSMRAEGGPTARSGFATLAVFWLVTTGAGWRSALARDTARHQRWMARSAALTFGAVMLRVWLPGLQAAGLDFDSAYQLSAWIAWVPNLAAVEFVHRHSHTPGERS